MPAQPLSSMPRPEAQIAPAPALDYLRRILTARVYEVARESELDHAPRLSARLGNTVWLKREDNQAVFSFKLRAPRAKDAPSCCRRRAA